MNRRQALMGLLAASTGLLGTRLGASEPEYDADQLGPLNIRYADMPFRLPAKVHKVEIIVVCSKDPSRIARTVAERLRQIRTGGA